MQFKQRLAFAVCRGHHALRDEPDRCPGRRRPPNCTQCTCDEPYEWIFEGDNRCYARGL